MHRTLKRQLKRYQLSEGETPKSKKDWQEFLHQIDEAYQQGDEGRYLLERSIEISSKEMNEKIDQLKSMSLQLAQAAKLASMGTLASGVAHELNNPIAAIKGYIEIMLERESVDEKDRQTLRKLLKLSDRMADTVKNLLKLARQSSVRTLGSVDIREPIRDSLELMTRQFEVDNIQVETRFDVTKFHVSGDLNRLAGVIQNLLTNSRDAFLGMKNRKNSKISILVTETSKNDKDYTRVQIRDNAGGISEGHLARVFDPFFTTKEVGIGTGLGLSISKQIIEELDGEMNVETDNEGTGFELLLPQIEIKTAPPEHLYTISAAKNISGFRKISSRRQKVLIVDDEEDICDFLETVIEEDFDVTTKVSPIEALECLKTNTFDLVITDLKMPEVSGEDLVSFVRKTNQETQIIIMSGHVDPEVLIGLERLKPFLFIPKPFPAAKKIRSQVTDLMLGAKTDKSAA